MLRVIFWVVPGNNPKDYTQIYNQLTAINKQKDGGNEIEFQMVQQKNYQTQ
jgi:hypothetical protein